MCNVKCRAAVHPVLSNYVLIIKIVQHSVTDATLASGKKAATLCDI